jgi:hypothetical protein
MELLCEEEERRLAAAFVVVERVLLRFSLLILVLDRVQVVADGAGGLPQCHGRGCGCERRHWVSASADDDAEAWLWSGLKEEEWTRHACR